MEAQSVNRKTPDCGSVDLASENVSKKGDEKKNDDASQMKIDEMSSGQGAQDNERKEEKPDEDVPEDFFDDFLKEDFMAGLDIVDEDNEDTTEETNEETSEVSRKVMIRRESKITKKLQKGKIDNFKKFKNSPPIFKYSKKKKTSHDRELKKLDRKIEEIKHAPPKKLEISGVDADNFDIRRDPEKTRKAIQRDKIKSAKDKEKRLITDIVQTGLVPPGMELEVNIEEVRKTDKKEHITDLREKIRSRKSRSKSNDNLKSIKKRSSPLRKTTPPKRRRSRTPPKNTQKSSVEVPQEPKHKSGRNRSPIRKSPVFRHGSQYQRSLLPRHSPVKRRSPLINRNPPSTRTFQTHQGPLSVPKKSGWSPRRSPIRGRMGSPHRSPTRRRSRSRSLTNRRSFIYRKSRSRDHSLSYHRRRDHSYSPLDMGRRRTRSRSPKKLKKEEKVSFLEELVAKLNETHPTHSNILPIAPQVNYLGPNLAHPVVTPVPPAVVQQPPAPVTFFMPTPVPQPPPVQPIQTYDPYDESFFIGNTTSLPMVQSNQYEKEQTLINPTIQSTQANGIPRYEANLPDSSDKDVAKLFGDKRIKLSDFLAITAKPQVSNASSAKLQEKIKVIQRCQDAIKVLNERRFTGPLVVHKTDSYEYSKDMTVSPLLRKPIVQLPFTTPGIKNSNEKDFTKCCETLLFRVGIEKKLWSSKKQEKIDSMPPKKEVQKNTPLLISTSRSYSESPSPVKVITKSLSTQTDKELSSCKECLRRRSILSANCGVQAGSPMVTFSVSTQVTEADFYSMIPKTQSLASLTPAQLLGKQSMIADNTKSSFEHSRINRNFGSKDMPRSRQIPSPPPPPPLFHYPAPQSLSLSLQNDSYPPLLFSQHAIPPLMQTRSSIPPNKQFNDDRRGGFNKRF